MEASRTLIELALMKSLIRNPQPQQDEDIQRYSDACEWSQVTVPAYYTRGFSMIVIVREYWEQEAWRLHNLLAERYGAAA